MFKSFKRVTVRYWKPSVVPYLGMGESTQRRINLEEIQGRTCFCWRRYRLATREQGSLYCNTRPPLRYRQEQWWTAGGVGPLWELRCQQEQKACGACRVMSAWSGTLLATGGCMHAVRGLPVEPRQVAVCRICRGACWGHTQAAVSIRLHQGLPAWSGRCLVLWGSVFWVERMARPRTIYSVLSSSSWGPSLFFSQGALGAWTDLLWKFEFETMIFYFGNSTHVSWILPIIQMKHCSRRLPICFIP